MNNFEISELERYDQYSLSILEEMKSSILLANSDQLSSETRKQLIIDAILTSFKTNYLLNSEYVKAEFIISIISLVVTVYKYQINIYLQDLVIAIGNKIVTQIYLDIIIRSILKGV